MAGVKIQGIDWWLGMTLQVFFVGLSRVVRDFWKGVGGTRVEFGGFLW